ncbi:MAG: spermidine/putrescine ABC transporter substrate-binding protein [Planctomycetia bacterium]|nr:spermidine/putrescine ABC transporter substrate-binding protein [Planctomycetia bacterium]
MKKLLSFAYRFTGFMAVFAVLLSVTLFTGCNEKQATLSIYNWEDYIDPELVTEFEKKHNCRVVIDTFDSNESMLAKIQASDVGYDIIVPSTYTVDIMLRGDMLQKLDPQKLPNTMKYIDRVISKKLKDENMQYSVPYLLSFSGIGYNAEKLGEAPKSWKIFTDERFKGRMTMLNDARETIGVGLLMLGYSVNTRDEKELEAARDLIISWKPNLAKFGVDDAKQELKNGEHYVVHGYSGDIMQFTLEDPNIQFTTPEEGVIFSADHLVIPKNAKNPELAHAFIDFLSDPEVSARNMEYTQFRAPNLEGIAKVSEELRNRSGFAVATEAFEKFPTIEDVGEDIQKYQKVWDEIIAAQ